MEKSNEKLDKKSLLPLIEQFFVLEENVLINQSKSHVKSSEMTNLWRMMLSNIGNQCKTNLDIKNVSLHVEVGVCKGSKSPLIRVAIVGALVDCKRHCYHIAESNFAIVYVNSQNMWYLVLEKMTEAKQKIEPTNE